MLVFLHPRVSSPVSGFPVASPCLRGKLQNISFSKVSRQVVMSFCVAGVALCDIPTCLITRRKCQNWRRSRTKCSFFCTHVSRLQSLIFSRVLSMGEAPHSTLYNLRATLHNLHFRLQTPHSTLYTPHFTLCTLHSSLPTRDFTLRTPHFTLHTPHSTLYTRHFTLHSTLHT